MLLYPDIQGLETGTHYKLRVAYEALVVVSAADDPSPLCHFKYQDIICWGHGKHTFQFKVFGNLFGQQRSDYVTVRFETTHGKVGGRRRDRTTTNEHRSVVGGETEPRRTNSIPCPSSATPPPPPPPAFRFRQCSSERPISRRAALPPAAVGF